jgi:glycosyltransferase involved in cell wall biosynthesis
VRVLFVLEHFYPYIGGTEQLFYNLSTSLVQAGHEVRVITTRFDRSLPESEIHQGIGIQRVNSFNRYFFTVMALPQVLKHAEWADIIHTTSYNAGFPASIAGKWKGKKVVITFHEVWGSLWWRLPFLNIVLRTGYFLVEFILLRMPFDQWVAVSENTRQRLVQAGVPGKKISLIYNGLDYSVFPVRAEIERNGDRFLFLFYGRQGVSKGLDLVIPAFEAVANKYPNARLQLVLSNKPNKISAWVRQKVNKSTVLQHSVSLTYDLPRNALLNAVAGADAVLIPSYSEGFCFAAAESVAIGTPLIISGKGALPEVAGGKVLVMHDMSTVSLADCMVMAINAKWQVQPVKRYELAIFIERHLALYSRMWTD